MNAPVARLAATIISTALVLAACVSAPDPGSSATPTPSPSASNAPSTPRPSPRPTPSPTPTATPTDEPTPWIIVAPVLPPVATRPPVEPLPGPWSGPADVGTTSCHAVSIVIDGAGSGHIAADCLTPGRTIQYLEQVGTEWRVTRFDALAGRAEYEPELAIDGDTLYLAYTRIAAEDAGCSDSGIDDDGVYVRSRSLPSGAWSEPRQIGAATDHLQAFRVSGGVIHATVRNQADGLAYYQVVSGQSASRYEIARAFGEVSLRIGGDGKARIAYEADEAISYGTFTGSGFTRVEIPGTRKGSGYSSAFAPILVLGAGDRPYLMWRHGFRGGCTLPDDEPRMGTYFGTLVDGRWETERLTSAWSLASFTVDAATGEVHALIKDTDGLKYLNGRSGGPWTTTQLDDWYVQSALIRRDARTGALLIVYTNRHDEPRIYAIQRP